MEAIDGVDLLAANAVHSGVQGRDAYHVAAVVTDGLQAALGGKAGGDAGHDHQDIFVADVLQHVVPEDHLAVGIKFRLHNGNISAVVHAAAATVDQFFAQTGADDGRAIQTQNGIDGGVPLILRSQDPGHSLSLRQAGLLKGDINIIIDVAVVGRKMAFRHTQGDIALANGEFHDLKHSVYLRTSN